MSDDNKGRLGRLTVSFGFLKDVISDKESAQVLTKFVVLDARPDWNSELIEYIVYSPEFDPVGEKEEIPEYVISITKSINDAQAIVTDIKIVKKV